MVLIAAAVCTKAGKTIVSRQFVEMTKARIEGLLAAFPKLIPAGTQHTFVETDSVRYVYQPMERLYMVLITTRASNILEDLETLRLFARVIPEYCRSLEENEIAENAFNIIFAFDEIVALGYRESVNLSQIRTFVEMDSHEEKVHLAVRMTQEREAKNKMREKAKELQRQKMEANKRGGKGGFSSSTGFGNSTGYNPTPVVGDVSNISNDIKPPSYTVQKTTAPARGMKLGGKSRDVESFVDQLKSEGENVHTPVLNNVAQPGHKAPAIKQEMDGVHLRSEEKLVVRMGRDGGVQSFELLGLITLHIGNEQWGRIRVKLDNSDNRGVQLQTHPNVDRELFKMRSLIGLKNPAKPFPLNTDVGVLKWRLQSTEESFVPLLINCWPSETGDGGCDVNIEYELTHTDLELSDVNIYIPLPMGSKPVVSECEGNYTHEAKRNQLIWSLALIDSSTKNGSLEFSVPKSTPNDFFPLTINFTSKSTYAKIKVTDVLFVDDDSPVNHNVETVLFPDKYEIV
ncbi:coatomer subunit delta [Onthophagus taurus]|uniref:coatomer subunit delta n=1 Tax=Onthophagus taurus TaxID=166361 RepID=UPI000C2014D0|nr:coatomer subunit delta [Onthophagus taurus]